MKNPFYLLLSVSLLFSGPVVAAPEKIVVLAEDAWYPYSGIHVDSPSDAQGITVDLVRLAFERAGVEVEYKTMPYDRAKNYVEEGRYIACFNVPFEPVIEKHYLWPDEKLFRARSLYYVNSDSPRQEISSVSELKGVKVGLVQGYGYGDSIDNDEEMHKVYSKTTEISLKKLLRGRIEVAIVFEEIAKYLKPKMDISSEIRSLGLTDFVDINIAFSKDHPQSKHFLELYNKGFAEILSDGSYDRVIANWDARFTRR